MTDAQRSESDDKDACIIDIAAGLVLAAMSTAALFWLIPTYVEIGTSKYDVGPAFFPRLTAMLVFGFSCLLVIIKTVQYKRARSNPSDTSQNLPGTSIVVECGIWTVISILSLLGIFKVGFLFVAPLLVGLGAIVCGYRVWWVIAVLAISFPFIIDQAAWFIFTVDLP